MIIAQTKWPTRKLAECGRWVCGGTPSKAVPSYWNGDIPWISSKSLKSFDLSDSMDRITQQAVDNGTALVPPGTVMFVVRGMSLANEFRVGVTTRPVAFNQDLRAIVPAKDINGRFLAHYLKATQQVILSLTNNASHGTKRLPTEMIESILVPFPTLPEQRRIAAILDQSDAIRRKRQEGIRLTEQLLHATFMEMFGDPATNPKGWKVVPLGTITDLVTSGVTPTGGSTVYVEKGPIFIRSQNVLMNRLDLSEVACLPHAIHESMSRTKVHAGDVLLNITGASIGRVTWVNSLPREANVNQHVCIIRLDQTKATPEFVSAYISLPFGQRRIDNMQSGASRQGLNHQQVRSLTIPLPPLALQQRFSRAITMLRKVGNGRESGRAASDALFHSLVQKAFRGGL